MVADLNVTLREPPTQLSITFTSSVSMILQHWPTDVTGFTTLIPLAELNGVDGTAYDSQYPRHAFVLIENCTQSGISIILLWPAWMRKIPNFENNFLLFRLLKKNRFPVLMRNDYLPTLWQPGRCHTISFVEIKLMHMAKMNTWIHAIFDKIEIENFGNSLIQGTLYCNNSQIVNDIECKQGYCIKRIPIFIFILQR